MVIRAENAVRAVAPGKPAADPARAADARGMTNTPAPGDDPRTEAQPDGPPARRFGWWDMFLHPDDDPRTDGGFDGERATLVGYLRDQRLTLELKCSGLDADAMARRSVPPSNMSLLGLVRHMAEVERASLISLGIRGHVGCCDWGICPPGWGGVGVQVEACAQCRSFWPVPWVVPAGGGV